MNHSQPHNNEHVLTQIQETIVRQAARIDELQRQLGREQFA